MLEMTLESPLDCKGIQPFHSEGDQPWDFFGRNDAKADSRSGGSTVRAGVGWPRVPIEGTDRELVLVNLHLEAYDDGEGKIAQTRQLLPSIRVFSNESTLCIRWPKYWSFSFSIIPSKEIPGLISFGMD